MGVVLARWKLCSRRLFVNGYVPCRGRVVVLRCAHTTCIVQRIDLDFRSMRCIYILYIDIIMCYVQIKTCL